ncbi:MAG: glucose-6-phosphate isomerase, partial [Pseudomonadales bacterium]|nr:glucose-6-phosphate isomerase [Pseudomonadales bacterium]
MNPERTGAWKALGRLATDLIAHPLENLLAEPERFKRFSFGGAGLLLDLSRQRMTSEVLSQLIALAAERQLPEQREALFEGARLNTTERRSVLHTALRAPPAERPPLAAVVETVNQRTATVVDAVRSGHWRGYSNRAITDVVHIGIGGSHLGPELAVDALNISSHATPRIHFVANIDGLNLHRVLRNCDPERTLFIIASKSFSTLETRVNATSAQHWFLERVNDRAAIARHFVAVSSNVAAATAFGIAPENVFELWDWVGGRFSLWSAVGLPVALAIGNDGFSRMLAGAHEMDVHFRHAPAEANLPLLLALTGIWNSNFLGIGNHAVLAYSERLRLLPDYLQQLEME